MGQISKQLTERPKGTFPSDTIVNPREQCNAISLRSGKVVSPPSPPKISKFEKEGEPQMKSSAHDGKEDTSSGVHNDEGEPKRKPSDIEILKWDPKNSPPKKTRKQILEERVKHENLTPYEISRLPFP